ncbi:MAG: hypothetical protein IKU15_00240 [Clostridia bacterium]|nr:hypothetical protein [Clostridia bacterium]
MAKNVEWNEEFGTGGKVEAICDCCGKSLKYKFDKQPYKTASEKMKKRGWFSRKLGDDWYDFCSDECFDKFRE